MVLTFDNRRLTFWKGHLSKINTRKSKRLKTVREKFDRDTGALLERETHEGPKPKPKNGSFQMQFLPEWKQLTKLGLKGSEWDVFVYLVASCEWGFKVHLSRSQIQQELKITHVTLWRALNRLHSIGLLTIDQDDPNTAYLDPALCWRGKDDKRNEANKQYEDKRQLRFPGM